MGLQTMFQVILPELLGVIPHTLRIGTTINHYLFLVDLLYIILIINSDSFVYKYIYNIKYVLVIHIYIYIFIYIYIYKHLLYNIQILNISKIRSMDISTKEKSSLFTLSMGKSMGVGIQKDKKNAKIGLELGMPPKELESIISCELIEALKQSTSTKNNNRFNPLYRNISLIGNNLDKIREKNTKFRYFRPKIMFDSLTKEKVEMKEEREIEREEVMKSQIKYKGKLALGRMANKSLNISRMGNYQEEVNTNCNSNNSNYMQIYPKPQMHSFLSHSVAASPLKGINIQPHQLTPIYNKEPKLTIPIKYLGERKNIFNIQQIKKSKARLNQGRKENSMLFIVLYYYIYSILYLSQNNSYFRMEKEDTM